MRNKKLWMVLAIFSTITILWVSPAFAASTGPLYGAETSVSTFYAPSYTDLNSDHDGGQGFTASESSISDDRGEAQANSTLGLAPVLKAKAYHTDDGLNGARGTAWAIEGYTYTGSSTQNLSLAVDLTGSIYNPLDNKTWLLAAVYVCNAANFVYCTDLGKLFLEYEATLINGKFGEAGASGLYLGFNETVTNGSDSGNIDFDVDPGQQFYVWAYLHAQAEYDQSLADAYSTLTLEFDTTTNLTAQSTVPIPGAVWLLGSGLLGLVAVRRKRK